MTDKWKQASGGTFHKWDTPGSSIEGIWQGTVKNRYDSLNGVLHTPAGTVAFPYTAALKILLQAITVGTEIKLVYNGMKFNQNSGKEFKDFTLYVADNGDNADPDKDLGF